MFSVKFLKSLIIISGLQHFDVENSYSNKNDMISDTNWKKTAM